MNRKKVLLTTAALLLIGGGGFAYWRMRGETAEAPFVTTPVQRGNITQIVSSTGTLQAVVTVQVGSQVSGTIDKLFANFNSKVKAGQVVAQLNQDKFKAAVDQAKANFIAAQSSFAKAKVGVEDAGRTLQRTRELRKRELTAQSELDAAQTAYDAALAQLEVNKAQITQAQAAINQVSVDLNNTTIRSPVDGIVISRNVDQGQTVASSMNAPVLYQLAEDLTQMQVLASIDESEIGKVRPGQVVSFRVDAYPTENFHGTVNQVRLMPTTVQNVVTYTTVIDVPNDQYKLKPGMTATVNIEIARREDVLRAPAAALRFRPTNDMFAALKQEVPPEMQRGRGGPGGQRAGGPGSGGPTAAAPQGPSTGSATQPNQRPQQQASAGNQPGGQRRDPSAQGGGDSTGSPRGDSAGGNRPRGEGMSGREGGGGRGNMTEEERAARRKQFEERMKNMSPEERAQWEERMRSRGQGGGRGQGPGGPGGSQRGDGSQRASTGDGNRGGQGNRQAPTTGRTADPGTALSRTNATTIDALFAAPPPTEGRGTLWLYINKQLKSVRVRTGITDGTWTEIIDTPETAQLQSNTEVVTNIVTGLEPANRPGQQGAGSNPLMPQRGQPGGGRGPGGPGGGGGGGGRGR